MDWFNHEFQEKGESFKLYLLRTMDYRQKSKPGKQDFMGIYFSKKKVLMGLVNLCEINWVSGLGCVGNQDKGGLIDFWCGLLQEGDGW